LLEVLVRIALGIIMLWASVGKIRDPQGFAEIVENYQIVPPVLVNLVAVLLPWVEAICGLSLILGFFVRGSSLIVNLLMLSFITAFILNIFRGIDVSCGCFSVSPRQTSASVLVLIRDSLFLIAGIWVFYSSVRGDAEGPGLLSE
jgi:putative oxidoreductase